MLYYSTEKKSEPVKLNYAVLKGLADDGGLYMPNKIPRLDPSFFERLHTLSLQEIGFAVASRFLGEDVPSGVLHSIVEESLNFDIPLVQLEENVYVLELFHGPTMAFKDVGARFMSRLMAYFLGKENQSLKVIVATSGDTGSAVASGFFNVPGIDVYVLFPKGKVSPLQQKQITTWGGNIHAIEVNGSFDDCQALAKRALGDWQLKEKHLLTSANSINIARLLPQSFYYFYGAAQLADHTRPLVFSVPSGNFGNLTAGLIAAEMGLPVKRFVAATNINDVVPEYFKTSCYSPRPSKQTISNAMDVGNPSNYVRMLELFDNDHNRFCGKIYACAFTDEQTRQAIQTVLKEKNYLTDPHGAVAWLGAKEYLSREDSGANVILLETAHPAKFPETLPVFLEKFKALPPQLQQVADKEEKFIAIDNDFDALKEVF